MPETLVRFPSKDRRASGLGRGSKPRRFPDRSVRGLPSQDPNVKKPALKDASA